MCRHGCLTNVYGESFNRNIASRGRITRIQACDYVVESTYGKRNRTKTYRADIRQSEAWRGNRRATHGDGPEAMARAEPR